MRARFRPATFFLSLALIAAGFAVPLPARAQAPMPEMHKNNGPSTGPLKISANGKTEELTAASLSALLHESITVMNGHTKTSQTYSGVPLIALLARLGVADKPHGKDLGLYVVAEGSDGYKVAYSIGEITPDIHDGTTLVADSVDGKPLGDNGLFQLVTTGEKRPARWVRNLVAVRVEAVP